MTALHTADRLSVSLSRDVHAAAPADSTPLEAEARAVELHASDALLQALRAGADIPMTWPGMKQPCKLSCILAELGYADEKGILLRAVHLTLVGKYEAANVALQCYALAIVALYGKEMAGAV